MKRIAFFAIITISLFVIQSLVRSMYTLWQKHDLLTFAETELRKQRKENSDLKQQLAKASSESFTEQEARNKLFLQKPGESRIIVDEYLIKAALGTKSAEKKEVRPYFQQWWKLFF